MTDALHHPFADPPIEGSATEVAPGLLWMRLPLPMALDHVNVYALDDGSSGWTVIDAGLSSRRGIALWERLLTGPLRGRPVHRLIVTHHHPDHVGLAGWFQARGATLHMTRTAWLYARMLALDVQDRPTAQAMAFWRGAGLSDAELSRRAGERPFNFADVVHPMPLGFEGICEGQVLRMGGRDWTVRLGGGHAPDHATFWSGDLVLAGDQVLPGISPNIGVYPTEPGADPLSDWLESCTRLAAQATERQLVLPGHKLPFTGLPFRLSQLIENHHSALDRLTEALVIPRTAVDCFSTLFRREIASGEEGLALAEAVAHLNHLLRRGAVSRSLAADGRWLWQRAG